MADLAGVLGGDRVTVRLREVWLAWRFPLGVSLLLLAISSVPVLYGYLSAPPGKWFSGVVYNVHDTAQYFSWMREFGQALVIENRLTSEPSEAVYFNLHWWVPGRVAAWLGWSLSGVYQVFRIVGVFLAVWVLYWVSGLLVREGRKRRFVFLLSLCSSGLGWIWVVEKYVVSPHTLDFPRDVYTLAGNTLWVMTAAPHLTFALALTVGTLGLVLEGYRREGWGWSVAAGVAALVLGMGHIYDLVTVWAVVAVWGVLLVLRDGWRWRVVGRLALVVLISAPAPLYWGWVASDANPMWKQALRQYDNLGVFTPELPHLIVLLGLPFLVALFTFDGVVPLRRRRPEELLVKGWFGVTLLLVYLPLRFQIMLLTGYQVPVAVLAGRGLFERVVPWLRERWGEWGRRVERWMPVFFLLAVLPTNGYLIGWRVMELGEHGYPYYLSEDELEAFRWLEYAVDREAVVLSSYVVGHYLPGMTGRRPFLANAVMTMDSSEKAMELEAFFSTEVSEEWRRGFLERYGIDYLFYGPAERMVGGYDPGRSGLFERVAQFGEVTVYAVAKDGERETSE